MVEVARLAGVSVTTVSHVLNDTRPVRGPTREAVLHAVRQTGYVPNSLARALRTSRTHTLGLAMQVVSNPYLGHLVRALQAEAELHGYRLLITDTHDEPDLEELAVRDLCERQVDGVLLAPSPAPSRTLSYLDDLGVPVTLVDRFVDGRYDQVGVENVAATVELVAHLVGHGHRRVALVSGRPGLTTTEERIEGFRRGLAGCGVDPDDAPVVPGWSDAEHAQAAVHALLRGPRPPSALVVANNDMTIGAVRALRDLGLAAPDDVALVGFDDFEWADLFSPRLTTMAQPDEDIGREAVRLLLARLADASVAPRTVRLAPRLVVRESCGCGPTAAPVAVVGA